MPLCRLIAAALCLLAPLGAASARTLDLGKPEDALIAYRKIVCGSTKDEHVRYSTWFGRTYSRVPWEKDRYLFDVIGTNIRRCTGASDPRRGPGFRSVSRELMFYIDPKSRKPLETFANPWTGESNAVVHVANDPVNMRESMFARDKDGKPFALELERMGDLFVSRSEVPLYYTNVLGGAFQKQMGGMYQAMEIFTRFVPARELLDSAIASPKGMHIAWNRVSQWLPWMDMEGRPGQLIFVTAGSSVERFDDLDPVLKDQIARNFPAYREPPPADDARPNETSWTYYKKVKEGKEKPSVR
jgi:hypothetical protein